MSKIVARVAPVCGETRGFFLQPNPDHGRDLSRIFTASLEISARQA